MLTKRLLVVPILFYSIPVMDNAPLWKEQTCQACIFQRNGHLPYIVQRYLDQESGPDENLTFGHCFVCIRCPNDNRDFCKGWWPDDPDGGDYEGDDGALYSDHDEAWNSVHCQGITPLQAEQTKAFVLEYAQNYDYQVINIGARSCLGFCEDVANIIPLEYQLPLGDYTIPGDLNFPRATWHQNNVEAQSSTTFLKDHRTQFFTEDFSPKEE